MKAKLTLPDGREFEVEMSEEQFKDVTKKRFFEPKEGDEYLTLY